MLKNIIYLLKKRGFKILESKKINENIYTETRALYQNELYIGFSIPWLIRGNVDEVAKVNQRIVALKEAELGILGLGLYLKNNYIQFYK